MIQRGRTCDLAQAGVLLVGQAGAQGVRVGADGQPQVPQAEGTRAGFQQSLFGRDGPSCAASCGNMGVWLLEQTRPMLNLFRDMLVDLLGISLSETPASTQPSHLVWYAVGRHSLHTTLTPYVACCWKAQPPHNHHTLCGMLLEGALTGIDLLLHKGQQARSQLRDVGGTERLRCTSRQPRKCCPFYATYTNFVGSHFICTPPYYLSLSVKRPCCLSLSVKRGLGVA